MSALKIAAVSYLNTKPFIYGLYKAMPPGSFDLRLEIPSTCANMLQEGAVDLALAPVAVIPHLTAAWLESDYCIGTVGPVRTVCLYADVPLADIQTVLLDFHSRTSVQLVQILFKDCWQYQPLFEHAEPGFEARIQGRTAGLIIGDRTIGMACQHPFVYDLGEVWTSWTGLPFVFAAWISTKPLPEDTMTAFNQALRTGLEHLPELIKILPSMPDFHLADYYEHNISYELDEAKWKGLNLFLDKISPRQTYSLHRKQPATHP
jgi:chorismate dehydratase